MKRLAFLLAGMVLSVSDVDARDRVILQPPDKASPLTISCDIADYDAERIEIHLTVGKKVHQYPSSQVVSVQTIHTESHRRGVRLFGEGDLTVAQEQFQQALADEPREWVKREILGWLIKIALRNGDYVSAGQRFLQIMAKKDAPREFAVIPLVWATAPTDAQSLQYGRLWLTGQTDPERLLGASILLLDQRFSVAAQAELDQLARSVNSRVALLARAQLWRLRVTSSEITPNELNSWQNSIERMPPELRAGPYFLLGRAALQRSEYDRAAAAFMWLPTVYSENEALTAQAAVGAATALQRIGRLSEARPLLQEILADYEWSSAARDARSLLSELDPTS